MSLQIHNILINVQQQAKTKSCLPTKQSINTVAVRFHYSYINFKNMGDDAVNEEDLILCCAACCANCSILPAGCISCSGKIGLCCLNIEVCCKPGAPCLPCCCFGPKCENDGCSIINSQLQCCCLVCSAALPCNEEVPVAVSVLGLTVFPKFGCCIKQQVRM